MEKKRRPYEPPRLIELSSHTAQGSSVLDACKTGSIHGNPNCMTGALPQNNCISGGTPAHTCNMGSILS